MANLPKRKTIRLKEYDYSGNGAYFITICIQDRNEILWDNVGAIINRPSGIDDSVPLSKYGSIVQEAVLNIPKHYPLVFVDKYVIMPDHVHLLILIMKEDKDGGRLIIAPTVSTVVQQFKRFVTMRTGHSIWQKSFYDKVIRNEKDYMEIWQYIDENPLKFEIGEH